MSELIFQRIATELSVPIEQVKATVELSTAAPRRRILNARHRAG